MKSIPSLIIAAVFATLTFSVWAYLNRPTREPPWPARIQGFAFSPFRAGEDPTHFEMPTDAEIDADLALLEGKVNAVRTYSVGATLADIPELADRHGLDLPICRVINRVILGEVTPRHAYRGLTPAGHEADPG